MLRAAVIGLGGVADRIHLPALRSLASRIQVVGACEPDPQRRAELGAKFGITSLHADTAALLAATSPDVVIVGTPPDTHHAITLQSLEHGAHVFCEKPFMQTSAEADEVIAVAARRERLVAVNNQYRFMPIYRQTQERVARGEFGAPFLIQGWQQMFHPPAFEKNWRASLLQSTLFEFGTHALDLICFFFGALPTSIATIITYPRREVAADVVVVCTLTFPGQRAASLVMNRVSHAPERYLEMRVDCHDASIRISLGGVARLSFDWSKPLGRPISRFGFVRGGEARVERKGRSDVLVREKRSAFATATAAKLETFIDRLERGAIDTSEARHARALIALVEAGYRSARTGATVHLDDDAAGS